MHTVELLDQLLKMAENLGYRVRHEYLGGVGGGFCEIQGQKYIFVDLALTTVEQLEQAAGAMRHDPAVDWHSTPPAIRPLMGLRKAA
jgi:hypothetical protein